MSSALFADDLSLHIMIFCGGIFTGCIMFMAALRLCVEFAIGHPVLPMIILIVFILYLMVCVPKPEMEPSRLYSPEEIERMRKLYRDPPPVSHPCWLTIIRLVACAFNEEENLTSSPLPSEEPLLEPRARVPDIFFYGRLKSESRSEPNLPAYSYTASEAWFTPDRSGPGPFGLHYYRPTRFGISSRWSTSASGTSSAWPSYRPLIPSPRPAFGQPSVFAERRRQPSYPWFNVPRPASPIFAPTPKPGATVPNYFAFAAPATALPQPFSWSQPALPPIPVSSHMHSLADDIVDCDGPSPSPLPVQGEVTLGPGMSYLGADQQVLIEQDVEMAPPVVIDEDVVMGY